MRRCIDEASKQSKRAVERDAELAELIASKKKLEDDLLQIERTTRNKHLLETALYKVQWATEDIEKFVRPSVAAGGDGHRKVIQAPPYIQMQLDIYMRFFAELQEDRLKYMTSASPEKLREMYDGVLGIDLCIEELLDDLRAKVDAHDKPAATTTDYSAKTRKHMDAFAPKKHGILFHLRESLFSCGAGQPSQTVEALICSCTIRRAVC